LKDHRFDPNNALFDPLSNGYSQEIAPERADRQPMVTLVPANGRLQESRTSQRFRGQSKSPDNATMAIINRRRR
jgi:hypothetical protein